MIATAFAVLVLMVIVAGCPANPFDRIGPQERPIYVNLTNTANTSHTLELWAAEAPLDVEVNMVNRSDYSADMGEAGISNHDTGDYQITSSLSFPERATLYGRYTLEPGGTVDFNMSEPYADTVYAVVIYNEDKVTSWVDFHCPEVMYAFGVTSTHYGASAGAACFVW